MDLIHRNSPRRAWLAAGLAALVAVGCGGDKLKKARQQKSAQVARLLNLGHTHLKSNDFVSAEQRVADIGKLCEYDNYMAGLYRARIDEFKRKIEMDRKVFDRTQRIKGLVRVDGQWISRDEAAARQAAADAPPADTPLAVAAAPAAKPAAAPPPPPPAASPTPAPPPPPNADAPLEPPSPKKVITGVFDLGKMVGKTRAQLTDTFPGTETAIHGWRKWKKVSLEFDEDDRLSAITLRIHPPMAPDDAVTKFTREFGLDLAGIKPLNPPAFRVYRAPHPAIEMIKFSNASSDDRRCKEVGIYFHHLALQSTL